LLSSPADWERKESKPMMTTAAMTMGAGPAVGVAMTPTSSPATYTLASLTGLGVVELAAAAVSVAMVLIIARMVAGRRAARPRTAERAAPGLHLAA
jgi:hypothetical protein